MSGLPGSAWAASSVQSSPVWLQPGCQPCPPGSQLQASAWETVCLAARLQSPIVQAPAHCSSLRLSWEPGALYYTTLQYTILYYYTIYFAVLYYSIQYYIIVYYTFLYDSVLYYMTLYYILLYYTILYCAVQYCTILDFALVGYTRIYYIVRSTQY